VEYADMHFVYSFYDGMPKMHQRNTSIALSAAYCSLKEKGTFMLTAHVGHGRCIVQNEEKC
jgi:hypothetical protein